MKRIPTSPTSHALHLRRLKLNTRVLLHPEFVKAPAQFALSHGVALVGEVFPSTSFKKDPDSNEKTAKVNANIHLVEHGAIRLFTERVGDDDWIRNIEVNPALLLYGDEDHLLTEQDLVVALSMLRDKVAPLLADPLDACHIVPGPMDDDAHIAYLSKIESEVLLPDIDLRCLHGVSHPDTGPAEGTTRKRIKLGDRGDYVICFEMAKWEVAGPRGTQEVQGVRVSLRLKGHALLARYGLHGATAMFGDTKRLVAFRAPDVARVHQEVMSQLEGTYLPVPPKWAVAGKATKKGKVGNPTTPAKVMALLSVFTPIPLDELRAMEEGLRHISRATRTRLNKAVVAARDCLKPVPVSSLFGAEVYATPVPGTTTPVDVRIDARVTAAYGPGVSAANP
jgi:hypothetical protein